MVHRSIGIVGVWLSLEEHSLRERGIAGSNPAAPTNNLSASGEIGSTRKVESLVDALTAP